MGRAQPSKRARERKRRAFLEIQSHFSDLKELNVQARGWFQSGDLEQTAKEIAPYNAAFYKIHPFNDGNCMAGILLLEHQAREIYEARVNVFSDAAVYRANPSISNEGQLGPLVAK